MMADRYEGGPILVAEDDPAIAASLRDALRADEQIAISCRTLASATEGSGFHRPSVIVIDVAMESGRGWELLESGSHAGTRWLALDREDDPLVRRSALAAGADDVCSAPFDALEIAARVRALQRRDVPPAGGRVLRHRDLVIDLSERSVRVAGNAISVTAQQFEILQALCEARGSTLHRSQLLARIAAIEDEPPSDRAVDLHVSRLRRRLGAPARDWIQSVYGIGYRLASAGAVPSLPGETAGAVLDAMDTGVIVVDQDLRIRSANRSAARLLGRADLVGHQCGEVMECRTPDGVSLDGPSCIGRAVLAGGGRIGDVRTCVGCGGWWMQVDLTHAPVAVDGDARLMAIEMRARPD